MSLSYVNTLMDLLLSMIRFFVFQHVVNDLNELPGQGIHGLPMGFPFVSFSPIIRFGLRIDPHLG